MNVPRFSARGPKYEYKHRGIELTTPSSARNASTSGLNLTLQSTGGMMLSSVSTDKCSKSS